MVVAGAVTLVGAHVVSLATAVAAVVAVPMVSEVDMRVAEEEAVALTLTWMTSQPSPLWARSSHAFQQALTIEAVAAARQCMKCEPQCILQVPKLRTAADCMLSLCSF